jgi:hypothetical protein
VFVDETVSGARRWKGEGSFINQNLKAFGWMDGVVGSCSDGAIYLAVERRTLEVSVTGFEGELSRWRSLYIALKRCGGIEI